VRFKILVLRALLYMITRQGKLDRKGKTLVRDMKECIDDLQSEYEQDNQR